MAGLSLNHFFSGVLAQQNSAIDNLYHIAMNGIEIVVDGEFEDWSDAKWVYLSVDHPLQAYLDASDAEGKMPTSPSDGSAGLL